MCDGDALAPAKATLKYARATPRGEIKRYPAGQFDIYVGETWERAVADQTEFLSRYLARNRESAEIEKRRGAILTLVSTVASIEMQRCRHWAQSADSLRPGVSCGRARARPPPALRQ